MHPLATPIFAIARNAALESVGRRINEPTSLDVYQWCVIIAAAVVVALIVVLGSWRSRRQAASRRQDNPVRLFWSLCAAHGLRWRERWVLWRIGRHQRLSDPARLFLEPERFEATNLSAELRRDLPRITALAHRLFAAMTGPG